MRCEPAGQQGQGSRRCRRRGAAEPGAPCPSVPWFLSPQMKPHPPTRTGRGFGKMPELDSGRPGVSAGWKWRSVEDQAAKVLPYYQGEKQPACPAILPETLPGAHSQPPGPRASVWPSPAGGGAGRWRDLCASEHPAIRSHQRPGCASSTRTETGAPAGRVGPVGHGICGSSEKRRVHEEVASASAAGPTGTGVHVRRQAHTAMKCAHTLSLTPPGVHGRRGRENVLAD